ncbi:MAG: hypothetical protein ACI8PZ_001710 [Myxococcota bacterium]|jgi:hypothetical protein
MKYATLALGGISALLLLVVLMQSNELATVRADALAAKKDLAECRVEAARSPHPPPNVAPARPAPDAPMDMGLVQQAFEDMAAAAPPPSRPPPQQRVPRPEQLNAKDRHPPDMPATVAEARQMFGEALDEWAEASGAATDEVALIDETFTALFVDMADMEQELAAGDLEFMDASRALSEARRDAIDTLRNELGEDGFRDMWRSVHPGKLLNLPRPR